MRSSSIFWPLLVIAVFIMATLAWALYHEHMFSRLSDTLTPPKGEVLMIVSYQGGLCPNSSNNGGVCSSQYKVYSGGTFELHTKLSAKEIAKLEETITNTDFLQYQTNPHPNCPSYSDGEDEILSFPQKYPNKSFTVCQLLIPKNDPGITFINELIENHQVEESVGG